MARYESGDSNNPRFWEIALIDNQLITRTGRIGSDGKLAAPKVYDTPEAAQKEVDKRIRAKLRQGFELVDDDISGMVHNPELEAAILANPDDDGPYLVYGDWLLSQGDPRGELIALMRQLQSVGQNADQASGPGADTDALEKKKHKLRTRIEPSRLARLARKKRSAKKKAASGYTELEWRLGFIERARVARNSDRPPHTIRELTAALLAHPAASLLRGLTIGALASKGEYDYAPVIEEIRLAAPASLRELFIADFDPTEHADLSAAHLGDISGLYPVLPRLETLHLRAGTMTLGQVALPALVSLTITTNLFSENDLMSLARARWPRLETLRLEAGGTALPMAAMAELADVRADALRTLALVGTDETGELWRGILRDSALLARLRVLDLSTGSLSDDDGQELLRLRHQLEHLQTLNLEANHLSSDLAAELVGICPDVRVANQRPPRVARVSDQQLADFAGNPGTLVRARKVAVLKKWFKLGLDGSRLWGTCQGSRGNVYDVYADLDDLDAGCTCPSQQYPCKHALALLMLSQAHPIDRKEAPLGFFDAIDEAGYDNIWE